MQLIMLCNFEGLNLFPIFHVEQKKLVLLVVLEVARIDYPPEQPHCCAPKEG